MNECNQSIDQSGEQALMHGRFWSLELENQTIGNTNDHNELIFPSYRGRTVE